MGDGVFFFYHSNAKPQLIAGRASVVKRSLTRITPNLIRSRKYYDPKSKPENPRWSNGPTFRQRSVFLKAVSLPALREVPELSGMELFT